MVVCRVQLGEVVAAGAVGTVYRGTVEGVERAIKVITYAAPFPCCCTQDP